MSGCAKPMTRPRRIFWHTVCKRRWSRSAPRLHRQPGDQRGRAADHAELPILFPRSQHPRPHRLRPLGGAGIRDDGTGYGQPHPLCQRRAMAPRCFWSAISIRSQTATQDAWPETSGTVAALTGGPGKVMYVAPLNTRRHKGGMTQHLTPKRHLAEVKRMRTLAADTLKRNAATRAEQATLSGAAAGAVFASERLELWLR